METVTNKRLGLELALDEDMFYPLPSECKRFYRKHITLYKNVVDTWNKHSSNKIKHSQILLTYGLVVSEEHCLFLITKHIELLENTVLLTMLHSQGDSYHSFILYVRASNLDDAVCLGWLLRGSSHHEINRFMMKYLFSTTSLDISYLRIDDIYAVVPQIKIDNANQPTVNQPTVNRSNTNKQDVIYRFRIDIKCDLRHYLDSVVNRKWFLDNLSNSFSRITTINKQLTAYLILRFTHKTLAITCDEVYRPNTYSFHDRSVMCETHSRWYNAEKTTIRCACPDTNRVPSNRMQIYNVPSFDFIHECRTVPAAFQELKTHGMLNPISVISPMHAYISDKISIPSLDDTSSRDNVSSRGSASSRDDTSLNPVEATVRSVVRVGVFHKTSGIFLTVGSGFYVTGKDGKIYVCTAAHNLCHTITGSVCDAEIIYKQSPHCPEHGLSTNYGRIVPNASIVKIMNENKSVIKVNYDDLFYLIAETDEDTYESIWTYIAEFRNPVTDAKYTEAEASEILNYKHENESMNDIAFLTPIGRVKINRVSESHINSYVSTIHMHHGLDASYSRSNCHNLYAWRGRSSVHSVIHVTQVPFNMDDSSNMRSRSIPHSKIIMDESFITALIQRSMNFMQGRDLHDARNHITNDTVIVCGYRDNSAKITTSFGNIIAARYYKQPTDPKKNDSCANYISHLITTAAVDHGMSGCPMFLPNGMVVSIVSSKIVNGGYAYSCTRPIEDAIRCHSPMRNFL